MPLSEEEERIINEMQRSFYESDPDFARDMSSRTIYRYAGRNVKWAALSFVAGLIFLVLSFAASPVLGFIGFLVMLGSAFLIERNLRRIGKASFASISESVKAKGLNDMFGDTRRRLRDRFNREG